MKLNRILRTFIVMTLVMGIIFAGFAAVTSVTQAQSFSATLTPVSGLVQILAKGTAAWKNVTDTALVSEGDQVRTGSDGQARLTTVTGVSLEIYPTTQIELLNLSMGDTSGQIFNVAQYVGKTFADIQPVKNKADKIRVVLPAAGLSVKGTSWYNFCAPTLSCFIVGNSGDVQVQAPSGELFSVLKNTILSLDLTSLGVPVPQVISLDLLVAKTKSSLLTDPISDKDLGAVKLFLKNLLSADTRPEVRVFLRDLLELPAVDSTKLDAKEDEAAYKEIEDAIDALTVGSTTSSNHLAKLGTTGAFNFTSFFEKLIAFLQTYLKSLNAKIPATTCGNGVKDSGETAVNCPDDFTDKAVCGNGICETDRQAQGGSESLISCPADCNPNAEAAKSAVDEINKNQNKDLNSPEATLEPVIVGTRAATPPPEATENPAVCYKYITQKDTFVSSGITTTTTRDRLVTYYCATGEQISITP